MRQLVWFELIDGRSVIANCPDASVDILNEMLRRPESVVTFTGDSDVARIRAEEITDFRPFDPRMQMPANAFVCNFIGL